MYSLKIQKFLIWIQDNLLNYPDISVITVKMFIDKFNACLSQRERENNKLVLQIISELSLKQISIDTTINNINYDKLQKEYNKLKR